MPLKINLGYGNYLTPMNTHELMQIEDCFSSRCVMCRNLLTKDTKSAEHIYPKWLQNQFHLWDKKLTLPNGSQIPYRQLTVPCCKECNGGLMADWEKQIQTAVEQGYDSFISLKEEVVVWWIYKLYYSKLIKELSIKSDIKNPHSDTMFTEMLLKEYSPIYFYMCELLKGTKFNDPKPYELYIYRTSQSHAFDYVDDISRHVVYLQMNDILIVCALDSFNLFRIQYENELRSLGSMGIVHPLQSLELFVKMIYFKTHYKFDTEHDQIIDSSGPMISSKIMNLEQFQEFNTAELYEMMVSLLNRFGYPYNISEYKEGTMFSLICGNGQETHADE